MEVLILWLTLSCVPVIIVRNKGGSGVGYFFLSLFFSPLLGLIFAILAKPKQAAIDRRKIRYGEGKKCPFCAEIIKPKAITCWYCGKDLPTKQEPQFEEKSSPELEKWLKANPPK